MDITARTIVLDPMWFIRVIVILLIIQIIAWPLIKKLNPIKHLSAKRHLDNKTPILLSYYSFGNQVAKITSGEIGPVSFKTFVIIPGNLEAINAKSNDIAAVYALELDFNTQAHIIGLGKEARQDSSNIQESLNQYHMERVLLEGNFHDYFDMFAARGQQTTARYIFDPKAMESYIEFLKYNHWEIVGDEMYIAISNGQKKFSPALENAHEFVSQIRPALIRTLPGEEPVYHEPAYGEYKGDPLICPLCSSAMQLNNNVHFCPNGHGILIFGRDLIAMRKNKLFIKLPTVNVIEHEDITCPNCGETMFESKYQGTELRLDVCMKCAYRWIDGDEVARITNPLKHQ